MKIERTNIEGLIIIEPKAFTDARGFFFESFQQQRFHELGINVNFVQDNMSRSARWVLRGLHYQLKYPQGKLVTVTSGEVFDVVVDIRRESPTFKQWFGIILSDKNHKQFYIPPGFAHGFCVLSEIADFHYKCTNYYHPEDEHGVIWNDPHIGIEWPIKQDPILSAKDSVYEQLRNIKAEMLPIFNRK
jgi:dTDP-4-dehydrorhamnose 3,5-epimerase